MRTWWYLLQIIRRTARYFTAAVAFGAAYFGLPLVLGLATQAFFDALSGHAAAGLNVWTALALLLALQLARSGVLAGFDVTWVDLRYAGMALLRANLLRQVLKGPGAVPLPDSAGEAISRFRDDAETILNDAIDGWVDLVGRSLFALAAFVVMVRINAPLALAVALMLGLSVPIVTLSGHRVATYGRLNHEAIGRVTGFLAEMFGGVQAIKAAGATSRVITHFQLLGERRRQAAVRDHLWQAVITAVDANVVTLGTGLILLIAGQALRTGTFTVGDFSLFVVYLTDLMWFPDEIARFFTSYRQAEVSLVRLAHLLGGGDPRTLVEDPHDRVEPLQGGQRALTRDRPRTHQCSSGLSLKQARPCSSGRPRRKRASPRSRSMSSGSLSLKSGRRSLFPRCSKRVALATGIRPPSGGCKAPRCAWSAARSS